MIFRELKDDDVPVMAQLRRKYYLQINEPLSEEALKKFTEKIRGKDNPKSEVIIAEDGDFAGFIWLEENDYGAFIKGLHVVPEKRGKGIGEALVEKAQEWAREKGLDSISLTVKPGNTPAEKLYDKKGYYFSRNLLEKKLV